MSVKLNTGYEMPQVGFGTWQSPNKVVGQAVTQALKVGYRQIDCAWAYGNEKEVGDALTEAYKQGICKREDIFLTSKLWCSFHDPKDVKGSFLESLSWLQTDYMDLYLMHWPFGTVNNGETLPQDKDGNYLCTDIDYVDTWKAMEELQKEGLVRSIGISNFNEFQINRVINEGSIPPAVHQIECHPYLNQEDHLAYCRENKIEVMAYATMGSPCRPWGKKGEPVVLDDLVLKGIASANSKTVAQIALRFQVQRGVIIIPKSVHEDRIKSNFQVLDFTLSDEDMTKIRALNRNWRGLGMDWMQKDAKFWSFRPNYNEDWLHK